MHSHVCCQKLYRLSSGFICHYVVIIVLSLTWYNLEKCYWSSLFLTWYLLLLSPCVTLYSSEVVQVILMARTLDEYIELWNKEQAPIKTSICMIFVIPHTCQALFFLYARYYLIYRLEEMSPSYINEYQHSVRYIRSLRAGYWWGAIRSTMLV